MKQRHRGSTQIYRNTWFSSPTRRITATYANTFDTLYYGIYVKLIRSIILVFCLHGKALKLKWDLEMKKRNCYVYNLSVGFRRYFLRAHQSFWKIWNHRHNRLVNSEYRVFISTHHITLNWLNLLNLEKHFSSKLSWTRSQCNLI